MDVGAGAASPAACLQVLNFTQKVTLWTAFLRDKLEPVEFEWLADAIAEGALSNRMEWELALQEAMDLLGFRMVYEDQNFAVFDGEGRRLYFGVDSHSAAVRAWMKICFPLNYS